MRVLKALIIGGTTDIGGAVAELMRNNNNIMVTAVGRKKFDVCSADYNTDLSQYDYLILSCGVDPHGNKPHLEQEWGGFR